MIEFAIIVGTRVSGPIHRPIHQMFWSWRRKTGNEILDFGIGRRDVSEVSESSSGVLFLTSLLYNFMAAEKYLKWVVVGRDFLPEISRIISGAQ